MKSYEDKVAAYKAQLDFDRRMAQIQKEVAAERLPRGICSSPKCWKEFSYGENKIFCNRCGLARRQNSNRMNARKRKRPLETWREFTARRLGKHASDVSLEEIEGMKKK